MSMPVLRIPPDVTEIQQGAYLSNGRQLYEVVAIEGEIVVLRNCWTEHTHREDLIDVLEEPWWLIKTPEERT